MSERIVRQVIDDIDGSEIPDGSGGRVEFSVRGVDYQIDLSTANIAKFEKVLKPYVDAAEKVRGPRERVHKTSGNGHGKGHRHGQGAPSKEQLAAVRDWARKNGYDVSTRGRIKGEVIEAFEAAH